MWQLLDQLHCLARHEDMKILFCLFTNFEIFYCDYTDSPIQLTFVWDEQSGLTGLRYTEWCFPFS